MDDVELVWCLFTVFSCKAPCLSRPCVSSCVFVNSVLGTCRWKKRWFVLNGDTLKYYKNFPQVLCTLSCSNVSFCLFGLPNGIPTENNRRGRSAKNWES